MSCIVVAVVSGDVAGVRYADVVLVPVDEFPAAGSAC